MHATSALTNLILVAVSVLGFFGMMAFLALGKRFAHRRHLEGSGADGTATVQGTLFALLGLLVALSFAGSETRLDARRDLVVEEATAIGTAYQRLDLLSEAYRPSLQDLFRRYVDARIDYYLHLLDTTAARTNRERADELQRRIWSGAVEASAHAVDSRAALLVLPALNEMFDITLTRDAALRRHIPLAIFAMLGSLGFACAFVLGMTMAGPKGMSRLHGLAFAGALTLTAYVILNLEFPRLGFVRMEHLDGLLAQVRASMR